MKPISKALFVLMGIGIIAPSSSYAGCREVWSGSTAHSGYTASGDTAANCSTWNADTNNGYTCGCATCATGYTLNVSGEMIGPYILTHRCVKQRTPTSGTSISSAQTCTTSNGSTGYKYACNCPSYPRGTTQTTPSCSASGAALPCFVSGSQGSSSVVCSPGTGGAVCNICGCADFSSGSKTVCTGSWTTMGLYEKCSTAWSNAGVALPANTATYTCEVQQFTGSMYRCAAGYYPIYSGQSGMFSIDSPSTNCKRCPQYKNKAGTTAYGTSAAGATSIASCYFNTQTCSDTAGTYTTSSTSGTTDAGSCCPA